MSIIDKIFHPTRFRNSYHKVAVNLAYTAFWLIEQQKDIIKRYDLTWLEFNVLLVLRERYPYTMVSSGLKSRIPHIAFSPALVAKKLISKELVELNKSAPKQADRGFRINKNGLILLTKIDKKNKYFDKIIAELSPGEAEELSLFLDKARG